MVNKNNIITHIVWRLSLHIILSHLYSLFFSFIWIEILYVFFFFSFHFCYFCLVLLNSMLSGLLTSSCITFDIRLCAIPAEAEPDDEDEEEAGECLNPSIKFVLRFLLMCLLFVVVRFLWKEKKREGRN